MGKIRRALISIFDKSGVVEFARGLADLKIEILSTGGTAKLLRDNGIGVIEVSDYTGQPEILDGRLKTLHPKIHGGILAVRSNKKHLEELKKSGIEPIDLVVVNLYPFEESAAEELAQMRVVRERAVSLPDFSETSGFASVERIDIGGPTMLRAAAKNWQDGTGVCGPAEYAPALAALKEKGEVSTETNFRLAKRVFALTARYDASISNYLSGVSGQEFSDTLTFQCKKVLDLRYGENPHQKGAWYQISGRPLQAERSLQGKEQSYNNLLDTDAAIRCIQDLDYPFSVVIVKHGNPCGVGIASTSLKEAFLRAMAGDPVSAFGGIVATGQPIDEATAEEMAKVFFEVICAPEFSSGARGIFAKKKNLRLVPFDPNQTQGLNLRTVCGGLLVQTPDALKEKRSDWKVVTKRSPTSDEYPALELAWKVAKHVRSNAIVLADRSGPIGIGAGQMSRIDSVRIAISKMREVSPPLLSKERGTGGEVVLASDAFFPFRDSVDEAAKAGVTAIIQPGGSLKDQESIDAADEHGIAMVFTGVRHFRH